MRVLPYGDAALLVEVGGTGEVLALHAALVAARLPGVVDLVPAARTVLVVLDEAVTTPGEVARALPVPAGGPAAAEAVGQVEVPVVYDGPDLAEVARATGLAEQQVVAAHTGTPWTVAFVGFAPGFGYLTGGDPRLAVPRRAVPRTRVPAGAVGLAGEFSGVYPRASPGGWQLLGHTDLAVWDLARDPPALLRPGVRVRFVEA